MIEIGGAMVPARPYRARSRSMPIGVQIVAASWQEADALRIASAPERDGGHADLFLTPALLKLVWIRHELSRLNVRSR
jgi:Asp-tRNA(Asn)/Glu-tRNA(Gln) amidotransferase A subunit family amidase